jgi:hypothetical protein
MLTEADTKHPKSISDLCLATELDAHLIHGCLLQLEAVGYVRQISWSVEITKNLGSVA